MQAVCCDGEVRKTVRYFSLHPEEAGIVTPGRFVLPWLSVALTVQSRETACKPPGPFSHRLDLTDIASASCLRTHAHSLSPERDVGLG